MKFYCGIDLSARDCHVCVIDQQLKVMVQFSIDRSLLLAVMLPLVREPSGHGRFFAQESL